MKRVFRTGRIYVRIFTGILLCLILIPAVVVKTHYATGDGEELIILGIFYLGFSPVIIVLSLLVRYYQKGRISITGDSLEYRFAGESLLLDWEKIDYFIFDYICVQNPRFNIDRYYLLYEAGNNTEKIRFYRLLKKREWEQADDIHTVNPFRKKAFRFRSYGLYLDRKECSSLVSIIRDHTRLEPERKKGMF